MRQINKLSAARVKHETVPGRYGDGGGLYLEVSPTGGKSWIFMWKRNGRRRCMGLGSEQIISLEKARKLAKNAAETVNDGRDPIADRKKEPGPSPSPRPPSNAAPTLAPSGRQSGIGKIGCHR